MAEAKYVLATALEAPDTTLVDAEFDLDIRLGYSSSLGLGAQAKPVPPGAQPYKMLDDTEYTCPTCATCPATCGETCASTCDDTCPYTCKGYTCVTCPCQVLA